MRSLADDLRYAVRLLRRSSGFTAGETLTLRLGIGATTAIFTVASTRPDNAGTVAQGRHDLRRVSATLAFRLCKLTSVEMKR